LSQIADIRQGTNISIALSPDGTTLVVDLLGGLWKLPATGGGAVALVPAGSGVGQPRFDRDGKRIVVQRWLDGQWDLWLFDLQTSDWRALTQSPYDEREPEFSADGRSVLFAANPTGRFTLWQHDLGQGALRQLTGEDGDSNFPTVADTGDVVYVRVDRGISTLRLYDGRGGGAEIFRSEYRLAAPSWRPGGRVVVFEEIDGARSSTLRMLVLADEPVVKDLTQAEDVFAGRVAWRSAGEVVYTADGQIWRRGLGAITRMPLHLFAAVGLPPSSGAPVATPLDAAGPHRATGILGASSAPDGSVTAFAALGDLWLAERRGTRRLTDDPYLDAFPSFAADGEAIVFVSDRGGTMDLWQLNVGNGVVTQLTGDTAKPYAISVDPGGTQVAYLETEGLGPWSESLLQLLDLSTPYRPVTIARGLYAARGLRFLETDGALEIQLEASRRPADTRREQLSFRTAVPAPASAKTSAPMRLDEVAPEWTPLEPAEPYVIEVGRLFDGVRNEYQRHMDIHVDGQRIAAVVRRGALPRPSKVVDAREATVYPGLIDVHVHQSSVSGERLGRMWLVNGVTTVREITDDLADALERAESWASGRRLGPRLIISPTLISDGIVPSTVFTLEGGPELAPGFGHLLYAQQEQHGLPELALPKPLQELVRPSDTTALPYFRISAGNVTYQDTLAVLLASQTAVSTGFAALGQWPGLEGDRTLAASLAALFSPGELGAWMRSDPVDPKVIAPLEDTVARIVRGSGRVTIASDAPAVPYGYGVHTELALLARAGIPNDQVLRLASAGGALALGLGHQLGTIEAGKLADLAIVSGDPLARITDTATLIATVRGGVWLTREELLEGPWPNSRDP
jgi:Tol biopolymer transport system component/imidazolonepropionase-like amidohydrolase